MIILVSSTCHATACEGEACRASCPYAARATGASVCIGFRRQHVPDSPDSGRWSREDQLRPSRGRQDRVGPTCPARAISIQEASSTLGTGGLDCPIGWIERLGSWNILYTCRPGTFASEGGRKRNPRKRYKVSMIFFRFDRLTFRTSRTCGLAVVRVGALGLLGFHLCCTWVHFPTSFVQGICPYFFFKVFWVILLKKVQVVGN